MLNSLATHLKAMAFTTEGAGLSVFLLGIALKWMGFTLWIDPLAFLKGTPSVGLPVMPNQPAPPAPMNPPPAAPVKLF